MAPPSAVLPPITFHSLHVSHSADMPPVNPFGLCMLRTPAQQQPGNPPFLAMCVLKIGVAKIYCQQTFCELDDIFIAQFLA